MADTSRIDDLRRRVQKDSASIAFAQLAEEYRRTGQFQDAVDICRRGLNLHPTYLSAHVTLGRSLASLGRLDEAARELENVLSAAPQNLAALRGLAEIHQARGAVPQALALYQTALVLAPNDPELERTVQELSIEVARATAVRDRARNSQIVTALEDWLTAVHVTRAQSRA